MELRTCGESEPRERDKGVNSAQPPGPPLPTWGPNPACPTLGSQLPRFSSRREVWEGERQGCACLLLPPLPSAGPFPSRQETSPDSQPAATLPPPPPSNPGPRSHTPLGGRRTLRLRPGSSAPAPQAQLTPGAAPAHRPLLLVPGPRLSLPHAGPAPGCWQRQVIATGQGVSELSEGSDELPDGPRLTFEVNNNRNWVWCALGLSTIFLETSAP
ncbi:uncharacterized protein LOC130543099 isoform X2 [Ursus arctos]|uniref:uncharacterized protein LOC130543099 isoform X2 n=1 Tax=Ursus arctos TaxID=9644 RepID=UPI002546EC8E|nr:uncharacterized protein LOC130543099 isoform X2 [Ursus arctos]